MIQDFIDLKKIVLFFLAGIFIIANEGFSQVTPEDSTSFEIQNPLNYSPQEYEIQGIQVVGLTTTRPSFVISQTGFKEGSTITIPGQDVADAIQRLHRTGLFSDIKIVRTRTTSEGVYLEIRVQEQPRLQNFELKGINRSERTDIRERLNLLNGFAVTKASKVQATNTIKRYYKQEGHWFTKVDVSTGQVDTVRNRVKLIFDIDPGEKLEVKEVSFKGNDKFSDKTLTKSLGTFSEDRWWKFFSKQLYKEEEFETALNNLRNFYLSNGYLDFRVQQDSIYTFPYNQNRLFVFNTPAAGIKVDMTVSEGPQYKVRNISWEGNTVYTNETLSKTLGFKKGDVLNKTKFDQKLQYTQSGDDVSSLYQNAGYLFFRVEPDIDIVAEDSVDITLNIYEDEIATIKRVSFTGNTKTHDDIVRRSLRTIPGNKYNRSQLVRTIRELGTLGYFQPQIEPDLLPDRENKTVDINYPLEESQSTDNFEFSGGYGGPRVGVILSAKVNFNNFSLQRALQGKGWNPIPSGDGQKLSIGAQISGSGFQSYNISFQEPYLGGRPNSFGVSLSYDLISRRFSNERNKLFSSSVSLGRRLEWPDDYFTQRSIVSYQIYDIQGGATFLAEGTSNILSFKQVIERNSLYPTPISPAGGSKFSISGEIAPPLPNFSQFYKLKSSYENHTTITGKLVLTNSIEYGYLGYLGQGQRSDFQRFVLGGTQLQQRQSFIDDNIDLRGYPGGRGQSITPRERNPESGRLEEIGGRLYSKYSMELRVPVVQSQQAQIIPYTFFDAGNAYRNFEDFAPLQVKRSTGFGMRVFLPILGLVDLSYGYRLDGIPQTQVAAGEWEFLFNIGAPF